MNNSDFHSNPNLNPPDNQRNKWFEWVCQLGKLMGLDWYVTFFQSDRWSLKKWIRWAAVLALITFSIACIRQGVVYERENQVGVMANNLTGDLQLKDRVGYHVFIPYLCDFYLFEKTIQKMDLTWSPQIGGSPRDIRLKTRDGSDVSLDITLNVKLIPSKAVEVLTHSGRDMRFIEIWLESYARHISLETFGELSTEELYNAEQRNAKAQECRVKMNQLLNPQGIEIIAFIPGEIRYYKEYENVIQEKKLADQQVEEQQAQARASQQEQLRQIVEEQGKADVQIRQMEGENENRILHAKAESEKIRLHADQSFQTTVGLAEASLYSASASAQGLRVNKIAEAEGMQKIREALSGDGGFGIIGLEYARRLSETQFRGTPITQDPHIQKFSVQQEAATPIFNPFSPTTDNTSVGLSGGQE